MKMNHKYSNILSFLFRKKNKLEIQKIEPIVSKFNRNLALYFDKQCFCDDKIIKPLRTRNSFELIWQLTQIEDWDKIKSRITNLYFFDLVRQNNKNELLSTIEILKNQYHSFLYIFFKDQLKDIVENNKAIGLASIMIDLGETVSAKDLLKAIHKNENYDSFQKMLDVITLLGKANIQDGHYWIALDAYEHLLKESAITSNKAGKIISYNNQAKIYFVLGEIDKANKFAKIAEALLRTTISKGLILENLIIQFNILFYLDMDISSHYSKINNLNNKIIDKDLNREFLLISGKNSIQKKMYTDAMDSFKLYEIECKELGDKFNLQICYGMQGTVYYKMKERDKALLYLGKKEELCYETDANFSLQEVRGMQAEVYYEKGEYDVASRLLNIKRNICERHSYKREYNKAIEMLKLITQ